MILSRGTAMEEAAIPLEETWKPVVCRLCAHRFEVLITCPEDAQITLCQCCTLLVEWFGRPEPIPAPAGEPPALQKPSAPAGEPPALQKPSAPAGEPPALPAPAPAGEPSALPASQSERATRAPKKARKREQLAGLLDQCGDLWRSGQEE
jgi:hypothetical protein